MFMGLHGDTWRVCKGQKGLQGTPANEILDGSDIVWPCDDDGVEVIMELEAETGNPWKRQDLVELRDCLRW